jgi:hypothetical protein
MRRNNLKLLGMDSAHFKVNLPHILKKNDAEKTLIYDFDFFDRYTSEFLQKK